MSAVAEGEGGDSQLNKKWEKEANHRIPCLRARVRIEYEEFEIRDSGLGIDLKKAERA
jgi:hypothetical protein